MHRLQPLGIRPNNLPLPLTQLVGRKQEVAHIQHLLGCEDVRLLTLTGPGGVGKTRLALQAAEEMSEGFADGIFFVNLAPVRETVFVISTIAQTLDIKESGGQKIFDLLKASLRKKQLLLLLDNFEQVVEAASQIAELLATCPELKVLVTSRMALHIQAEHEFAVPPLTLPDPRQPPALETLAQYEAVALFIERAGAIKSDFQVTHANIPTIAAICVRLDGLPLAIELAAARIKLLPPPALLARLSQRLPILTSGARDAPARQQTLRNTIEWSYHLLNGDEQRLFRRLSIFVGGCTLEAAEAVCAPFNDGDTTYAILDGVASLIDKSLLRSADQEGEVGRLLMLETIREYGLEALARSEEIETIRQAYAEYYLALAEEVEPWLTKAGNRRWLERLQREHENLRAVLAWFAERKEWEAALKLGSALWRFWWRCGYYSEGRAELARSLAAGERCTCEGAVRAKALHAAGSLANVQADFEQAEALGSESLALFRVLGDIHGSATSLITLGHAAWQRSDYVAARSLLEEGVTLYREVGDRDSISLALVNLATVFLLQGEYDQVRILIEEAVELSRERGDTWDLANALRILALAFSSQGDLTQAHALLEESLALARQEGYKGVIASSLFASAQVVLLQGDVASARSLLDESLALFKALGDRQNVGQSLFGLGWISFLQGDYVAARTLLEESLDLFKAVGNKWFMALCLTGFAALAIAQREWTWAARLSGAAEILCREIDGTLPPTWRAVQESTIAAARAQLAEEVYTAAWVEGHTMTLEQALAAQGQVTFPQPLSAAPTSTPSTKPAATSPAGLTAREMVVLRLLAQGLTSAQIAEQLVIGLVTVNSHVRSIYSKLGVTSRAAATRYALEHHLL